MTQTAVATVEPTAEQRRALEGASVAWAAVVQKVGTMMDAISEARPYAKGDRVRYLPTRQTGIVVKVYDVADGVSLLVDMGAGDYLRMPVEDWERVE